jgi:hypothetical protein
MNYNYLFIGIGLSISMYGYLLFLNNKKVKLEEIIEEVNLEEVIIEQDKEYGFGYILNEYPILTIYIKGHILNKKKNNLLQTSYPNGFPDDSYIIISFDEKFTDYIGVVKFNEFKEIKNLLVDSTSEELKSTEFKLKKDYFDIRNQFAEAQLHLLTIFW